MPMKFRISSEYGAMEEVRDGQPHNGIDLAMSEGTQLRSVAEGVADVVDHGSYGLGKGVIIESTDGTQVVYGHLSRVTIKDGEHVDVGEMIGYSGNTGHSTGPHLHFGIKHDGQWIDPTPMAETVSSMSGVASWKGPLLHLKDRVDLQEVIDGTRDSVIEGIKGQIYDFLYALGEVLLEVSYSVTLIGTAMLIILRVAGMRRGYRWAGILVTVNAILRMLLGGVRS